MPGRRYPALSLKMLLRASSSIAQYSYRTGSGAATACVAGPTCRPALKRPRSAADESNVDPRALGPDFIPFNRLTLAGGEFENLREAIANNHTSGDGPFSKRVHQTLEELLGVRRALLTTNCTHALEMSALLLNVQPEDEFIVPSFTFVSTANAFVLRGAKPVFIDVRRDTLNLDESLLEAAITPRTKAILPVHYAGVGCEMDDIMRIAGKHGIAVIEDNAHGLFGKYRGRWLGTFGVLATQSFHETKNITCGEGGALLINDEELIEHAEVLREKGTNRSRFFRGQVDKYTWVGPGSSYLPSDLLAAFLLAQLSSWGNIQARRRELWETYFDGLTDWARDAGARLPIVPEHCEQAFHMFYVLMPSLEARARFIQFLRDRDIGAVFHYIPLHSSPFARSLGVSVECPVTTDVSDRLVRLPFFNGLTEAMQSRIIDAIRTFR